MQALENDLNEMNRQPQGRNRKSLTASQKLEQSSSKDEYFKNVYEIAKQKQIQMEHEETLQEQIDESLKI
jgi:hypothetical protein